MNAPNFHKKTGSLADSLTAVNRSILTSTEDIIQDFLGTLASALLANNVTPGAGVASNIIVHAAFLLQAQRNQTR